MTKGKSVRLSVNVSESVADAIRQLSERRCQSYTDTIRDCISTEWFLDEKYQDGYRIVLRKKGERDQELMWAKIRGGK
jgi:hypothetical protein